MKKLYCTRDCKYVVDGTRTKVYKFGKSYEFDDKVAEKLLTAGRRNFATYQNFKEYKKNMERIATEAFEREEKKVDEAPQEVM